MNASANEYVAAAYVQWAPLMVRYAVRYTDDWFAAEEVVDDVFMRLGCVIDDGGAVANLKAWLHLATKRRALNYVAKRRIRWSHEIEPVHLVPVDTDLARDESIFWEEVPGGDSAESEVIVREAARMLLSLMYEARGNDNGQMLVRHTEGWTIVELAQSTGQTERAVAAQLHRTREALRKRLDPTYKPPQERTPAQRTKVSDWYEEARRLRTEGWLLKDIAAHCGKSLRSVITATQAGRGYTLQHEEGACG